MTDALRAPSLGPLVGHVTSGSARLWIRGAGPEDVRTVGVAALLRNGRPLKGSPRYFRLHREYDRTGVVDFEQLEPETEYEARLGSIAMDSVAPDLNVPDDEVLARLPKAEVWVSDLKALEPSTSEARFRTFPASSDTITFLFGSCRYPDILPLKKRADRIFGAMRDHLSDATKGRRPDLVLMVGDQIYADLFNRAAPFGRADSMREFHGRYVEAWGTLNFRDLLRNVPAYMILDDHEIEDNWDQTRVRKERGRALFQHAIMAYRSYQWLHGPRSFGDKLHYVFECGGFPFFVADGRTQRVRHEPESREEREALPDNHLLGYPAKSLEYKGQIDLLCDWLRAQQQAVGDRPKFVVSASVFVPNGVDAVKRPWLDDAWAAFPQTRRHVLKTILEGSVQNVVFLSGDIHVSNVAEMRFERAGERLPLRVFSITSSAFYWPFPFADGEPVSYVHDSTKENDGFAVDAETTLHYRAWAFEQEDNFTRVDVEPGRLVVRNVAKDGTVLGETQRLELA